MVQEGPVLSPQQDRARADVAHVATFLMRTETEVREKAAEIGLKLPD